jgi:hypothetical protein
VSVTSQSRAVIDPATIVGPTGEVFGSNAMEATTRVREVLALRHLIGGENAHGESTGLLNKWVRVVSWGDAGHEHRLSETHLHHPVAGVCTNHAVVPRCHHLHAVHHLSETLLQGSIDHPSS